jgi:hypothetical protein
LSKQILRRENSVQNRPHSELPDWERAKPNIFPLLEHISPEKTSLPARIPTLTPDDVLSSELTSHIRMNLACFYQTAVIPLTDNIVRNWSISISMLQLALEENMANFTIKTTFEKHEKDGFIYYTVNTPVPYFNSLIPFYKPMRRQISGFLDYPFYFAIPERQTVILFDDDHLPRYSKILRNDVLLTHECSARAHTISPELIQASEEGITAVMDF